MHYVLDQFDHLFEVAAGQLGQVGDAVDQPVALAAVALDVVGQRDRPVHHLLSDRLVLGFFLWAVVFRRSCLPVVVGAHQSTLLRVPAICFRWACADTPVASIVMAESATMVASVASMSGGQLTASELASMPLIVMPTSHWR